MADRAPFLLDVTRLIWRRWKGRLPTGVDRVCLAYLRHFGSRAQAVLQHERIRRILDWDSSQELFALLDTPARAFKRDMVLGALRHFGSRGSDGRGRLYLNVGHTGLDSIGFRGWVRDADVRPVYFVHDLIPITHPQFCRAGEDKRHRERIRTVLTTANGIIGNSRATLDALSGFAGVEGLPNPRGVAAWLGAEPVIIAAPDGGTGRPFFVTVGTIEGRKNHLLLLDIWSSLIDRYGEDTPKLMIIGQRGWEADQVFERLDGDLKLRGHVIEVNSCSDEDLARHFAAARALLFPSFAEGYGLPLVEALARGLPVIASDLPVFREIGGDIPAYLDPSDLAGWEAAVLDYAKTGSIARKAQLKRISSFRVPEWSTHFGRVEALLHALG